MFNIISIYIPPFNRQPDNYLMANANLFANYSQESYFSAKDRKVYIVTKDSLYKVIETIDFKPADCEDYTFQEVQFETADTPENAREWISNRLASIERLRSLLQELQKGTA